MLVILTTVDAFLACQVLNLVAGQALYGEFRTL